MMHYKKSVFIWVVLPCVAVFADAIVLQNGHNSYTGCTDTYLKITGDGTELYPYYYHSINYDTLPAVETANDDDCGGTYTRALYRFDLSSVPVSSDNITRATFSSYFISGFEGITKTYLYRMTQEWKADEATWLIPGQGREIWNPQNDTLGQGGTFTEEGHVETACAAPGTWEEYDVTAMIKFFIENPDSNWGFIIASEKAINNIQRLYYSSDYADDVSLRPKLTIDGTIAIRHSFPKGFTREKKVIITNSDITITLPATGYHVSIIDIRGRTIRSFGKNSIPVDILTKGVHFLCVTHDRTRETVRFIVVR